MVDTDCVLFKGVGAVSDSVIWDDKGHVTALELHFLSPNTQKDSGFLCKQANNGKMCNVSIDLF